MDMCNYIYTHTRTHTHAGTHTHTHTHTHTDTYIHAYVHTYIPTYMHTFKHTGHTHTHTHSKWIYTHMLLYKPMTWFHGPVVSLLWLWPGGVSQALISLHSPSSMVQQFALTAVSLYRGWQTDTQTGLRCPVFGFYCLLVWYFNSEDFPEASNAVGVKTCVFILDSCSRSLLLYLNFLIWLFFTPFHLIVQHTLHWILVMVRGKIERKLLNQSCGRVFMSTTCNVSSRYNLKLGPDRFIGLPI